MVDSGRTALTAPLKASLPACGITRAEGLSMRHWHIFGFRLRRRLVNQGLQSNSALPAGRIPSIRNTAAVASAMTHRFSEKTSSSTYIATKRINADTIVFISIPPMKKVDTKPLRLFPQKKRPMHSKADMSLTIESSAGINP